MTQLAIGGVVTLNLADNGRVVVTSSGGLGSVLVAPNVGSPVTVNFGPLPYTRTFHQGFEEGGSVTITNRSAQSLDYEVVNPATAVVVVSASAPNNADGRPDGTVYIRSAS